MSSSWTTAPISVDGMSQDWDQLPRSFNEDYNLAYGVANNSTSLYILLKTDNKKIKNMLGSVGVKMWINPGDSHEKQCGIRYRDPYFTKSMSSNRHRNQMEPEHFKQTSNSIPPHLHNASIVLIDKRNDGYYPIDQGTNYGIQARHFEDHGIVVMELEIPLNHDNYPFVYEEFFPGETISIGIDIPGSRQRGRAGLSGMRGGGKGGGMGGRGGGKGRGSGGHIKVKEDKTFWISTTLANELRNDTMLKEK
ncbi:MAG: hypothetical protein P9L92_07355 [Candidatus Electryonea clarkiae]|nr:hypothetical protein [Candidatus Electryonea clarkiae]MDP8287824.1 hypothetical protein [Candidatus Electryonea clarkiae]